jgi:hypothetical protein
MIDLPAIRASVAALQALEACVVRCAELGLIELPDCCPVEPLTEGEAAGRTIVAADPASPAGRQERRRSKAKKGARPLVECERCRKDFARAGRYGPAPRFCAPCRRARRRERDRARDDQQWRSATAALEEQHRAEFQQPNGLGSDL